MIKINKPTILIAPLDWGLGHATRCIPIIKTLKNADYDIVVAVNEKQQALLSKEFCDIKFIRLAGYDINYAKNSWLFKATIFFQIPKMLSSIKRENKWLKEIIDKEKIDLVISDNRFGLYSKKIPCVFITHQLTIKAPFKWLENILQKINYSYINRYTQCWIPDIGNENNIAGILSHPAKMPTIPTNYLGVLSRFTKPYFSENKYDICVVLSGPEPQRTTLENILLKQLSTLTKMKILFVRGLPQTIEKLKVGTIQIENHLQQVELQAAICSSEIIVARSGYTTIMELLSLQKKTILIATPGQTEQEYLATHLYEQKKCLSFSQSKINIETAMTIATKFDYVITTEFIFNESKMLTLMKGLLSKFPAK